MFNTGGGAGGGGGGIQDRINAFIANPVWPDRIVTPNIKPANKRSTSILSTFGVREIDANENEWFLCLMDGCCDATPPVWIKCTKGSTSNAADYLRLKHNRTSAKTLPQQRAIHELSKQIDLSTQSFKDDPLRWFQVQLSAWAAEQSLCYRSFETNRWRVIASQLPVGVHGMTVFNPRKHNV
jgi:hypothetical protein